MSNPSLGYWQLKRQDDHGNIYFVGSFESQEEAEEVRKNFEEKGHKQMYWIERVGEDR
ncbi:MAG: SPOR domain-containing protein [Dehalococcoidia bacterium]